MLIFRLNFRIIFIPTKFIALYSVLHLELCVLFTAKTKEWSKININRVKEELKKFKLVTSHEISILRTIRCII
ncbi:hypothetical protein CON15_09605 [Bacillus cereus]|nr:hypothetical protein CON15_09605 [Bacillus cereus]PEQ81296.1 hypothetical protein CN482_22820 [Bacillus cereus]PEU07203.1 hypothetical protein CN531_23910 [Bacillus cereus]PEW64691.1 hypothetical protein CN443_03390 [Bacillus cereus]PEX28954.1 hypothetical protein CN459_22655 [Bacillus cereus]